MWNERAVCCSTEQAPEGGSVLWGDGQAGGMQAGYRTSTKTGGWEGLLRKRNT